MEIQVLQKIILSLTEISEQRSKDTVELEKRIQTIEEENKELKKELQKSLKIKENLKTLETEQNQLQRENQDLKEECRKCCNFVAHIQKRYTENETNVIQNNGQSRKKLKSIHKEKLEK